MLPNINDCLLYAYTKHGFNVKSIIDVEKDCLNTFLYLNWNEDGIFTDQISDDRTTYVRSGFPKEEWDSFRCEKPITFKLRLGTLFNTCRTLKKKDEISLSIQKSNELNENGEQKLVDCIKLGASHGTAMSSSRNSSTRGELTIMNIEPVIYTSPKETNHYPFVCPIAPQEWHKLCRSIQRYKASTVIFVMYPSGYCFFYLKGTFATTISPFGEPKELESEHAENLSKCLIEDIDYDFDEDTKGKFSDLQYYKGTFESQNIRNTGKLNNMGNSVVIMASSDYAIPICIKSKNNHCGYISIMIKSLEYREAERQEQSISGEY